MRKERPEPEPYDQPWYLDVLDVLDYLNRSLYAASGSITALQEGKPEDLMQRAWKGFSGKKKYTWDDILDNMGIEPGIARTLMAMPLDIATSYVTLPGFGQLTKLGHMGRVLGKVGPLSDDAIAHATRRMTRLGKLIEAGREVKAPWLKSLKGHGREVALALAHGKSVEPLATTLGEQAAKAQRTFVSLFGGRIPIARATPLMKGISKLGAVTRKSPFVQKLSAIFKRTTGHKGLDEAMFSPGGVKDMEAYAISETSDIGAELARVTGPVYAQLKGVPDDLSNFNNYVLSIAEKGPGRLAPHLSRHEPAAREAAKWLDDLGRRVAILEKEAGLPLVTRQHYAMHMLTPEGRAIVRGWPEGTSRVVRTKAFHGSFHKRVLEGSIPELNRAAKAGEFGEAASKIETFFVNDPLKIASARANRMASAVAGKNTIEALKKLSRKVMKPAQYGKLSEIPENAQVLAIDPELGLMTAEELKRMPEFAAAVGEGKRAVLEGFKGIKAEIDELAARILGTGKALTDDAIRIAKDRRMTFLLMDDDLAKAAMSQKHLIYTPGMMEEAARGALGAYDKIHGFIRRWTLGIFPGWMARNALGNYSAQWYMGMKPWDMARYSGKAGKIQHLIYTNMKGLGWKHLDDVVDVGGRTYRVADLWDEMLRHGVPGRGWSFDVWKMRKSKLDPTRLGFRVNRAIENNARVGAYMWARDRGQTPKEAARIVKKFLFDYGDLSDVERKAFHRVAFFYTWLRKNMGLQFETLLTRPGKIAPLAAAEIEMLKRSGLDKSELPEWAQEGIPLVIGKKRRNVTFGTLASWIPAGDLIEMIRDPKKKLFGSITPLISRPLETLFNRSVFMDRKIERYPGETKEFFGVRLPAWVAHLAETPRPISTAQRFYGAVAKRPEVAQLTGGQELIRFLTGIRLYTRDLDRVQAKREAERRGDVAKLRRWHRYYARKGPLWAGKLGDIEAAMESLGAEVPTYEW